MRYESDYAASNPTWHLEDAEDKVADVLTALRRAGLRPGSACDVGCGAGAVLAALATELDLERAVGFDRSEHAVAMARGLADPPRLHFEVGDAAADDERFDVLLLLDVLEHVGDPVAFLRGLRDKASEIVVNLPLELSVLKVLSSGSLARGRSGLGHVHYFNEEVARGMVGEAGFGVVDAFLSPPGTSRRVDEPSRRLLRSAQRAATRLRPSLAARTIGGCSLMMVLRPVPPGAG